ncbi:hypothetical protein [Candidatus Uabimicrobium sp. HlEnr_7]|uniref:hypothetical protein n=1 Tax=Candidatus Uabimicrobium helgolandensis TaxID=3095367 RepID=UPI0035565E2F
MRYWFFILSITVFLSSQETIVATLLQKNIYMKDIDVSEEEKQQSKKEYFTNDSQGYENWLWESRAQNLSPKIIGSLFSKYVKDNNLTPTKADIKAFYVDNKARQQRLKKEYEQKKQQLLKKLEIAKDKEKKDIQFKIENIEYEIETQNMKVSEWIVSSFIRSWKMNNSMYQKYGGRVIFQQMGPEPLDAYHAFLKDSEKHDNFQIKEKKLKKHFWHYFTFDKMHRFYSQEEGKKVMTSPWWK